MYTTKQIADALGTSGQTIRQYTQEFAQYLSDEATPPPGGRRQFSADDLRTLKAAKVLLDRGLRYDQAREQLAQGVHTIELDEPEPDPEPEQPTGTAMISLEQARVLIEPIREAAQEWKELARERQAEIDSLREENRRLREELAERRPWWKFWK